MTSTTGTTHDPKHFTIVAGFAAMAKHRAALAEAAAQPGFDLPRWQQRQDPTVGAEIVLSIYGYGLRYASGLQGFGIIADARSLGTLDKALAYAQGWADASPNHYVFIRNTELARAGEAAEIVAKREAGIEAARQAQREANERLYGTSR